MPDFVLTICQIALIKNYAPFYFLPEATSTHNQKYQKC